MKMNLKIYVFENLENGYSIVTQAYDFKEAMKQAKRLRKNNSGCLKLSEVYNIIDKRVQSR